MLACTPARHFSGRGLFNRDKTLWCSWVLAGSRERVFFCGDSGMMPHFAGIGEKYGPFRLTIMPIGAYDKAWLDIHTTPEQAVQAHQLLKGETVIPIHWATFDLALHTWDEPIERFVAEARKQGVSFVTPVVGEQVLLQTHINQFWWRKVSN